MSTDVSKVPQDDMFWAVAGSGASTWPWITRWEIDEDNLLLTVGIEDPEIEGHEIVRVMGTATMRESLKHLLVAGFHLSGYVDGEDIDLDAGDADLVVQHAVLGDIPYG